MLKVSCAGQVVGDYSELQVEFVDAGGGSYKLELMPRVDSNGDQALDIDFTYPDGHSASWESITLEEK